MKALVYHGPNDESWDEVPDSTLIDDTDAVVCVDATTIHGSDLHVLKGYLPEVTPGRILGHEAVGTTCSAIHDFSLAQMMEAYDVFSDASESGALKGRANQDAIEQLTSVPHWQIP